MPARKATRASTSSKTTSKAKSAKTKKPSAPKTKAKPSKKVATKKTKPVKSKVSSSTLALLKVGAKAPSFSLVDHNGDAVSLEDFRGKNVLIYFYPKDATPGCTIEACAFRDAHKKFEKLDTIVLGVSKDSVGSHKKFRENQKLPFRLLSDPDGKMITAYGSFGEKKFMGRTFMGILRTSVLIDGKGVVRKVYAKVSPKTHAEEVLADLL